MTTLAPTTIVTTLSPTTAAPTAAPTTAAPTTTLTTLAPTTLPYAPFDPDAGVIFNCKGGSYKGVPQVAVTISGTVLQASFNAAESLVVAIGISASVPRSVLFDAASELSMSVKIDGWGVTNDLKKNWVGWSKIGEASFILDRTNDAGFRPMDWNGYVYQVKKIDKNVMIYGSGGVTLAFPVAQPHPTFGFKNLHYVGVKNKTAVGGDEFVHFFIDNTNALYRFTMDKGLEYLGYEEFLASLTNPVMIYDNADRRLYINDSATSSFIFREDVLTGGQIGITGLYRVKDNVTLVAPSEITIAPVNICTDVIDLKRRGMKHIEDLQFGVSADIPLYAAVDFRFRKDQSFRATRWVRLNNEGVAHVPCSGIEFRIRLKANIIGDFDLSYIKIQHKYIDQRFTHDPRENPLDAY